MKTNQQVSNEIYFNNEVSANKNLSTGCLFSALGLLVVWILYLTGAFQVHGTTLKLVNISFPILIVVLSSTKILTRTSFVEKPSFKYFLIVLYSLVIFTINVLLPKHGILLWAACIIVVNHYFSPKIMLVTYLLVAGLMFFALYFGMFLGEWDPYTLNGAYFIEVNGAKVNVDNATLKQRIDWLKYLKSQGDNRYFKTFIYYYIPRLIILTVILNIGLAVSKRSLRMLSLEAKDASSKEKLKSELHVASAIQMAVLPKALEDANKNNIYGLMTPAKEVGGDFYDYFYIDDSHLALAIGDVSGKGIPASLVMMITETLIRSLTKTLQKDTANIMKRCNISLATNNEANVFVTCWLGIIDLVTGELKYCNAGHNKIVLIHNGEASFLDGKPGVVLGAFQESNYKENTLVLEKGDKLLLYTDGVTEAHNEEKMLYGEERLLKVSTKYNGLNPLDFVKNLKSDIEEFVDGYEQFDDITILMYKFEPTVLSVESRTFKADVKELDNLFDYSSNVLKQLYFSTRDIIMINTALEEVFVNVAKYAYEGDGTVEIILSRDRDRVTFIFKDNGKMFNPLEKDDPDITASSDEREIGGLGIYMVKKIMDEVTYEYINNQNVLTLVKLKK